ncbi:MAG: histidine phosphatase family protein [Pseudomonadota bacterium]
MKLLPILILLISSACSPVGSSSNSETESAAVHEIYLVRHAEKQLGNDPSLTPAGQTRAETLAEILSDKGLTQIYSTDYKRTLATAAPIAARTGLEIELYDASDLAAFANTLRATEGVHLVVGHSNTTPPLVQALGGDPGSDIDEASEYDRLYIVTIQPDTVSSRIDRYGVRYEREESGATSQ